MVNLSPDNRIIKKAAVLGSTGSVGIQTLDVVRELGLSVEMLAAGENVELLASQIAEFSPKIVSVTSERAALKLKSLIGDSDTLVLYHMCDVYEAIEHTEADVIFHSVGGLVGLGYATAAARSGKRIGMANKEAIIAGGDIIFDLMKKSGGEMIPVDSEHSSVFRCLESNGAICDVKKIILTASGGPFFGKTLDEMRSVKAADALAHPTWKMGKKITIDSATLMNKGFEIIEAVRLFGLPEDRVDVVVHRQSIIHSMVEYNDNTVAAHMGLPDMRDCIRYAATAPRVAHVGGGGMDLASIMSLTFHRPDTEAFPLLDAAREAIRIGGTAPTALIAADEEAVDAFLSDEIGFTDISSLVIESLGKFDVSYNVTEESIEDASLTARRICRELIDAYKKA